MICRKCGSEFKGKSCPECGTPVDPPKQSQPVQQFQQPMQQAPTYQEPEPTPKKNPIFAALGFIVIIGVILTIYYGNKGNTSSNHSSSSSSTNSISTSSSVSDNSATIPTSSVTNNSTTTSASSAERKAATQKPYSAQFDSGYYTVGIDFPAGTYTITAIKGNGNVFTTDGSLNALIGTNKDPMYEKEHKDVEFSDGTTLSLEGVSVKLTGKNNVDVTLKKRTNTATKSYTLSSGNYVAGKDIEAGIYDLSIVKGEGNVITEAGTTDDDNLHLLMGTGSDDMYQQKYMHVELKKNVKLTIEDATIKLTPSK